jgi:hypothetical protein
MSYEALALSLRREPLFVTAALLWSSEKSVLPKPFSFPWEIKLPPIKVVKPNDQLNSTALKLAQHYAERRYSSSDRLGFSDWSNRA